MKKLANKNKLVICPGEFWLLFLSYCFLVGTIIDGAIFSESGLLSIEKILLRTFHVICITSIYVNYLLFKNYYRCQLT